MLRKKKNQRVHYKAKRNKDGWGWRRLKPIGNDDFEKFSYFSKYMNDDVAPSSVYASVPKTPARKKKKPTLLYFSQNSLMLSFCHHDYGDRQRILKNRSKNQSGSKSTNHNWQTWSFKQLQAKWAFVACTDDWRQRKTLSIDWPEFACYWKAQYIFSKYIIIKGMTVLVNSLRLNSHTLLVGVHVETWYKATFCIPGVCTKAYTNGMHRRWIRLTCSHPCCHSIQTMWWSSGRLQLLCSYILQCTQLRCALSHNCNHPNELSHDLNWVATRM